MRKHITLDSIDCKHLKYDAINGFMCVKKDNIVCVRTFADATDCISCMRCKFSKQTEIENEIRNAFKKDTIEKVKIAHANDKKRAKRRAYLNKSNDWSTS